MNNLSEYTASISFTAIKFRSFEWKPQEDISAYELALCLPMIVIHGGHTNVHHGAMYDALPDNAKRHFVEL